MILEHARLDVVKGEEDRFEEAIERALTIISSMPGFRSLRLERCLESRSRYLLLVEWDRLEDHTEGFRGSAQYQEWRGLLHHFYDPFPVVEHYAPRPHRFLRASATNWACVELGRPHQISGFGPPRHRGGDHGDEVVGDQGSG